MQVKAKIHVTTNGEKCAIRKKINQYKAEKNRGKDLIKEDISEEVNILTETCGRQRRALQAEIEQNAKKCA